MLQCNGVIVSPRSAFCFHSPYKVLCFSWLVKDTRLTVVCHQQSSRGNHAILYPHGPKLLSHVIKLFLFFVYTGCEVLIKAVVFDVPFWPNRCALSRVKVVRSGSRFRASGNHFSKKAQASSPSVPSGRLTSLKFDCHDLASKSNTFLSSSLFLFSRTWTLACRPVMLSFAADIRTSALLTRSAHSLTSFFTFSIADRIPSSLEEKSDFKFAIAASIASEPASTVLFF